MNPALPKEVLEARGTYRKDRHAPKEKPKKRRQPDFRPLSRKELLQLITEIPGYDPNADAGDCWFDDKAANAAIAFYARKLVHIEGALARKPFRLERWQMAVEANLHGWKRKDAQGRTIRRYRECLILVPRKNGKTPWMAGEALFILIEEDEPGQQDYLAAKSREQAGKLFRHARGMVQANPQLSSQCRVYGGTAQAGQAKSIVKLPEETSSVQVIAADAGGQHGGNSHLIIIDELHEQPDRDLIDVLQTSLASENRAQPLMIFITTADFNRPSICNEKYDYACKVRDGIISDLSFLPVIYEAGPADDWTSEEVWRKANPNLGVSVSLDYLRRECKRAQETPAYENTFRRLHLNQRTETDVRAIPMEKWDAAAAGLDPVQWRKNEIQRLTGRECWAGLDLGSTSDLTALALLFREEDRYIVLPYFWAPRAAAEKRERRDRVPYLTWARQGFIELTEGEVTDYSFVRKMINDLSRHFVIRELAADRWNATQIITDLMSDGANVIAYGQGFKEMAAPTKALLELVIGGQLQHGGNPVLRWMASNASTETDAAGNLKFSKKKSTEKIDGIIALTMPLGRALLSGEPVVPTITWI